VAEKNKNRKRDNEKGAIEPARPLLSLNRILDVPSSQKQSRQPNQLRVPSRPTAPRAPCSLLLSF
jgi:hypothetical protein